MRLAPRASKVSGKADVLLFKKQGQSNQRLLTSCWRSAASCQSSPLVCAKKQSGPDSHMLVLYLEHSALNQLQTKRLRVLKCMSIAIHNMTPC